MDYDYDYMQDLYDNFAETTYNVRFVNCKALRVFSLGTVFIII